jgi:hypothetical protein
LVELGPSYFSGSYEIFEDGNGFASKIDEVRIMNYKLQMSPLSVTQSQSVLGKGWDASPANWADAKFFRSWLVYDSDLESSRTRGRVNWNMVMGIALVVVVSAAFWTAAGWVMAHLIK